MCSFVGLISEVGRDGMDDYQARECCVFGINKVEFQTIKDMEGSNIHPSEFSFTVPRFVVKLPPWTVMRRLGEVHGYVGRPKPLYRANKKSLRTTGALWNLYKPAKPV